MIWLWLVIFTWVVCFGLVVIVGAPYVPTKKSFAKTAFVDLYCLSAKDKLVDLGSGDGVVLRYATKLGARAVGWEINPVLFLISRLLSTGNSRVETKLSNFWANKLPKDTTVVYVFTTSKDTKRLARWLQNQTNKLDRPINVVTLGSKFDALKASKTIEPCNLYVFSPLQSKKAQV